MLKQLLKNKTKSLHQPAVSRRRFLVAAAATAGTTVAGFPMTAAAQGSISFRFQGAWSAKDIFHEYALDYARKVNDMSGGRLRIEVLSAGAVVKPHDLLDAVHKGVLDGCHAVPAYWAQKNSAFSLFGAGPALGMDANNFLAWMKHGGGKTLYEELHTRMLNLNVAGFLYGPMPTQPLGWFRKPVTSAAQLKGLRLRAEGLAGNVFSEMGAAVSDLPAGETVAAMRGGRLDAVQHNNASSDRQLGLPEVANVCMLQSYHRPAETFEVLFNRKKFEALPSDLKAIVRHAADAASADMSWKAIHFYSRDHALMRERQGVTFRRTPADVLRAQMKAWAAVATRQSQENPFFGKVFNSQLAWARRTVGWTLETIVDPRIAYEHWAGTPSAATAGRK